MSDLTDILAAVREAVVRDLPGTAWGEGEREMDANGAPPSVVWRRVYARPRPAAQRHGQVRSVDRALLGLAQSYDVRIWGADAAQLDALRVALVRALEDVAPGQYEYEGDTQTSVGVATAGEQTLARVSLACHVPSRPAASVVVGSARVARNPAAATGDGTLEPGDP